MKTCLCKELKSHQDPNHLLITLENNLKKKKKNSNLTYL